MMKVGMVRAAREAAGAGMWTVEKDKKGARTLWQYREDGKRVKVATMHATVEADDFLTAAVNSIGSAATEIESLREDKSGQEHAMAAVEVMHEHAMELAKLEDATTKRRGRIQTLSFVTVLIAGATIGASIANMAYTVALGG